MGRHKREVLRLVAANMDFATGKHADKLHLRHLLALLAGHVTCVVVGMQEAKNLRTGSARLARVAKRALHAVKRPLVRSRGLHVHQDTRSPSRAGSAFVSLGINVRNVHWILLGRFPATLARWIARGMVTVNGHRIVLLTAHFPPKRSGKRAQERALRRFKRVTDGIHRAGLQWAATGDFNMPIHRVARRVHGKAYGDGHNGITGIVTSKRVHVTGHGVDRFGIRHKLTDHPCPWVDIVGVRK